MSTKPTTRSDLTVRWDLGHPLDPSVSQLGWTVDGYKDYRGAPVNRYRKVLGRQFMKCDLSEADLSGIDLRGLEFVDCRFTKSNFASVQDIGNQFAGCIFTNCSFYEAYLGMRPRRRAEPSRYEDCIFKQNEFSRALFRNAIFRRTVFDRNSMKGVDFSASGFWDCKFVGPLEDVWFRGNYPHPDDYRKFGVHMESGLHGVDFSEAELAMVAISDGCPLENIVLPANGKCTLMNISQLLAEAEEFAARFANDQTVIHKLLDWLTVYAGSNGLSKPQEISIVCQSDLEKFLSRFTSRGPKLSVEVYEKAKSSYGVSAGNS